MSEARPRVLFVTGKLAEPALRRVLADLAPRVAFAPEVAVLPITVAALMTADWVRRHLTIPEGVGEIVLPGYCRGEAAEVGRAANIPVTLGPKDLRDLPEFFGKGSRPPPDLSGYDIEILAEINHAPRMTLATILTEANHYRDSGADLIDLGCDPGATWAGVGDTVAALRSEGYRVSVDSFDAAEVEMALRAGAERVLSVNGLNAHLARHWHETYANVEVVAIPDTPTDLESLDRTVEQLQNAGVPFRVDPILEPIAFGFAASLGRYLEVRRRYPGVEMLMGVGNLTELTDSDSAGINVLLAGFCQETGIRSVLTTEVISWARSAVKEFDLARRLVYYALREKVPPKRLDDRLVMLRDPKTYEQGEAALEELARRITDRNYRIFAERGELHVMNGHRYVKGTDPFEVFSRIAASDPKLDVPHAFYLGFEFAKAVTALTLGKAYTQDQALRWGFLTIPEPSHHAPPPSG